MKRLQLTVVIALSIVVALYFFDRWFEFYTRPPSPPIFRIYQVALGNGEFVPNDGNWHMVTYACQPYIDGEQVRPETFNQWIPPTNPLLEKSHKREITE
jgi:hypothetical protein